MALRSHYYQRGHLEEGWKHPLIETIAGARCHLHSPAGPGVIARGLKEGNYFSETRYRAGQFEGRSAQL